MLCLLYMNTAGVFILYTNACVICLCGEREFLCSVLFSRSPALHSKPMAVLTSIAILVAVCANFVSHSEPLLNRFTITDCDCKS